MSATTERTSQSHTDSYGERVYALASNTQTEMHCHTASAASGLPMPGAPLPSRRRIPRSYHWRTKSLELYFGCEWPAHRKPLACSRVACARVCLMHHSVPEDGSACRRWGIVAWLPTQHLCHCQSENRNHCETREVSPGSTHTRKVLWMW
jgi:hypothetical protein